MSKPLCLAISHTTNQNPSLQATGQHGAIGSAGTVFVCCPTCTSEKAEGHQPHIHGIPAQAHLKPFAIGPGNQTPRYPLLAFFLGIAKGHVASPRICLWLGVLVANHMWLLVLLEQGQLPGQRLKQWQAAAAEVSGIVAKVNFKRR